MVVFAGLNAREIAVVSQLAGIFACKYHSCGVSFSGERQTGFPPAKNVVQTGISFAPTRAFLWVHLFTIRAMSAAAPHTPAKIAPPPLTSTHTPPPVAARRPHAPQRALRFPGGHASQHSEFVWTTVSAGHEALGLLLDSEVNPLFDYQNGLNTLPPRSLAPEQYRSRAVYPPKFLKPQAPALTPQEFATVSKNTDLEAVQTTLRKAAAKKERRERHLERYNTRVAAWQEFVWRWNRDTSDDVKKGLVLTAREANEHNAELKATTERIWATLYNRQTKTFNAPAEDRFRSEERLVRSLSSLRGGGACRPQWPGGLFLLAF